MRKKLSDKCQIYGEKDRNCVCVCGGGDNRKYEN